MGVSVFPSGGYPDQCKAGHSWARRSGNLIIGVHSCDCPNARGNRFRHMYVRCIAHGCSLMYRDPPCSYLQKPGAQD